MGISFKIFPGVRIGATRRGMNASFGPRVARVHLGPSGVRYSSGLGPLTISGGGRRGSGTNSYPSASDESVDWSQFERHPDGHQYPLHHVKLALNMGNIDGKVWDVIYTKGSNKVIASVTDHDEANLIARGLIPLPKKKINRSTKKLEVSKIKELRPNGYKNKAIPDTQGYLFANGRHPSWPAARKDWISENESYLSRIFTDKAAALSEDETKIIATLEHLVDGNMSTRWLYEKINELISGNSSSK